MFRFPKKVFCQSINWSVFWPAALCSSHCFTVRIYLFYLCSQVHDGSLTILGITRDDRGAYTCRAYSDQGEVLHTTRLLVQGTCAVYICDTHRAAKPLHCLLISVTDKCTAFARINRFWTFLLYLRLDIAFASLSSFIICTWRHLL